MEESTAAEGGTIAPAGKSIEDELRQIHDGLAAERETETFPLPGYGEKLQVEYRVLTDDEAEELSDKVAEQVRAGELEGQSPMMVALVDALIMACVQFVTLVDGKEVPYHQTRGEQTPIRWGDERLRGLAGLVEMDGPPTARQIMNGVMTDRRLVEGHAREVSRWAEGELQKVRTDF
jgi:hypothetical protein